MKTIILLAERLTRAEQLLWEYVEQDECVCKDSELEDWTCLFCQAHEFVTK